MTKTGWRKVWKDFLEPLVFALVITQFLGTAVAVSGASMMPGLRSGERVLVPKYETWMHKAGLGHFQRGDILVFKPPASAGTRSFLGLWNYRPFLIKRLIALPGDRVKLDAGQVFVNGQSVNQSFATSYWRRQGCWDTRSNAANNAQVGDPAVGIVRVGNEFTVPAGQYFVMGDNRSPGGSEDSRFFGPVPLRDIAGRAVAVAWPPLRHTQATYDCAYRGTRPQDHVRFGGPSELNLRLLSRPDVFGILQPAP